MFGEEDEWSHREGNKQGEGGVRKGVDGAVADEQRQKEREELEYYERQQKNRKDKRKKQKEQELSKEDRRERKRQQKAEVSRFKSDLSKANTEDKINRIVLSNYNLPQKDTEPLRKELDAKKRKLKEKRYNKEDRAKVEVSKKGAMASLALIPVVGVMLSKGVSTAIETGNRAKNKARAWRDVRKEGKDRAKGNFNQKASKFIMGIGFGSVFVGTFLVMAFIIFLISVWTLVGVLLSHPEAIKELHANNVLGDALWMGNVTEDVTVDGEVIVKGRFDASPGCFIYNGIWYCGNCIVLGEDGNTNNPNNTKCDINYDDAGQGDFTQDAQDWAKDFNATFIGDSLGVGVESTLAKYFSNMNFDVKGSRWLIYNGDEGSTDALNGIHILRELAENDKVKDNLVVALGTNGGIKEGELEAFMKEVPSNVKRTVFVNTASEGGVDSEAIDKAIKDFVNSSDLNVGYLDWKKYAETFGRSNLYGSDDIHMTGEGYTRYGHFITQGLYDIFNTVCATGDLGDHNISGVIDDSNLRDGVTVRTLEGMQDWPRRVMNIGTNLFLDVTDISGYRAGDDQDHGQGLAVDFMVPLGSHDSNNDLGDVIAQWGVDNFEALNLNYIIWEQRIYGSWDREWKGMENQGTDTLNHFDHPHFSFNGQSGDVSKIKPPTKGSIEIPDVVIERGSAPSEVEDELNEEHDPTSQYDEYGIPKSDVDTTHLGDTDIQNQADLMGMSEEEYKAHKEQQRLITRDIQYIIDNEIQRAQEDTSGRESQLIVARGDEYTGTSSGPGTLAYSPESGYTEGIIADFDIRTKNPDWLDGAYIDKFLKENSHGDSPIVGHGDDIVKASEDTGIAAGIFLGQIAKETTFGKADCGGQFNIGCFEATSGQPSDWGTSGRWAAPPSIYSATMRYFEVVANYDAKTYSEYKEIYAPRCDNQQTCSVDINPMSEFENYTFGVLRALGYDISGNGATSTPSNNNNNDPGAFHCTDNCVITEEEKKVGTGNVKPLPKGKTWENEDSIINTDLGYMSDTVTPESLDKYIKAKAPSDSDFIGMGKVFYEAGTKSGYDPRYVLAHAIHETGWGTSQIWRDKNNPYGWMAYDDSAYSSSKDFETPEEGIIQGAQLIYKNYYVDYKQTSLYLMQNDPSGEGHNYATDPGWGTKIAAYMKAMEEFMGPSQGGSVGQQSNNYSSRNAGDSVDINELQMDSDTSLGRGCSLGEVTFDNLPYDPNEMVISSFYHDGNYPYGLHGGADMTYTHGGEGPIFSVAEGEVTDMYATCEVGNGICGGGWGNYVKIRHTGVGDGEWETLYAHLKTGTVNLSIGDKVSAGQEIATMGTTGRSDGIHLHLELWHNGEKVDNYPYFAWKDATYSPGWDNYAGPFTGEPCTPGASSRGRQGSSNRSEGCAVGDSKPGSNGLQGDTTAEQVYHFFKGHGFSDASIAGIMGNFMQESGMNAKMVQGAGDRSPNMTIEEIDELMERSIYVWSSPDIPGEGIGPAMGISQWEHTYVTHSGPVTGRWEGVMAWSAKNGYSHWDLEAQLNYIIREFGIVEDPDVPLEYGVTLINDGIWACNSDEGCQVGIQGFDNFMKTDDVEAAVRTYFQFNRAGHAAMSNRYAYAKEFYAQMANWG